MAHELAFVNGKAQMFVVGDAAWHREGDQLDAAPTYVAAMEKYGVDYPLEKRPYFRPALATDNPETVRDGWTEAGDSFYVFRPDIGKTLGTVGSSYEIVSNGQAFEALRPLVDEGIATIETGGVLRDGADAWMLVKWNFADAASALLKEALGDEVVPFSTVMANHSGRRGILLGNTPIRVVCANTLGMAETSGLSKWMTVTHHAGAKARLIDAAEIMFQGVLQRYEVIAQQYKLLKATALNVDMFRELVLDVVAPDPRTAAKFNPEAKLAAVVLERAERRRAKVAELWTAGKGHTGELNAWYAYNAAVEAIDHHDAIWPKRDGSWQTRGFLSNVYTTAKQRVLDGLVSYANAV